MKKRKNSLKWKRYRKRLEGVAFSATSMIGSVESLMIHTTLFIVAFSLTLFGISFDRVLLVVTTILSLEAIYLSIFIQMSVNRHSEQLEEIQEDVEEIQEDVEEIQEDVEEIQEDVEEIQEEIQEEMEDTHGERKTESK